MTKQPNQEPFYSDELVRLPPNFADSVLELEMRMDSDDSDLQCITQLNELYKVSFGSNVARCGVLRQR
jgi:hypothetical protein